MKKLLLLVLTVACILACLSFGATAEGTDPGAADAGAADTGAADAGAADTGTAGDGAADPGTTDPKASGAGAVQNTSAQETGKISSVKDITLKFFEKVASAFWRLRVYYDSAVSHFGSFERYMPVVLAVLILFFCFFGYRLFRVETVLVGAVTGYALAYATYDFLLAWQGHWAFLDSWEKILRWVLVGVFAILGMFIGRLLRRVGVSLVLGLLAAAYFARYSSNVWVLISVFAIVMIIGIVAIKPVVIFVTGVLGSVVVVKLLTAFLFGAQGFYPMDINAKLGISPAVNVVLIFGLLLGLICAGVQARTGRGRRYY